MKTLAIFIACALALVSSAPSKVDPGLRAILKEKSTANIFVSFKEGTSKVLNTIKQAKFETRGSKISALKSSLQDLAKSSQKNVIELLTRQHMSKFTSFWINNQVYVKHASMDLIEKIAAFPEVAYIMEEEMLEITPIGEVEMSKEANPLNEWGVSLIQAPEAWGLDGGNNGANVRVATIDTGVRYTHEALKGNFLGEFGWYDPYKQETTPSDQNGHGTHTTGTIAGQGGIGVAPGAKWMACKGCATAMCAQDALLSCGQFMLCPTDPLGQTENCDLAPHLVSNSWGGGRGRDMYYATIDAWNVAGIIPVFANGNSGPSCGSANSPADHPEAIAVGSTTSFDALSSFSSVGPSFHGNIKPDISAPGSSVRSSYNSADDGYATLSGTSMACPHAAGVIALLKSRDQSLTLQDVKKYLTGGTDKALTGLGRDCGGISEQEFPNHAFGHGRINALNSLFNLISDKK